MKQRHSEKLGISLNRSGKRRITRTYERVANGSDDKQYRVAYEKKKQEDTDTKERIEIHFEIQRLMKYGLTEKEVIERLTEKFDNSKYQMHFQNWVKDQYKKRKPMNKHREDELQL